TGMSSLPAVSVAGHGTTHLLFTPMDLTPIDEMAGRTSSSRLAGLIKDRRTAEGFEVQVPFSGMVSVFDVRGKQLAFYKSGKAGQWCPVPAARGTFIVKVAMPDRTVSKAVVLAR
ncbi:MAG: hypothetical protein JXA71_02570, partial [Chitinispirillaceae bacterium]|nr:hypothetical protein [Chitinispirillaceae bacterium]